MLLHRHRPVRVPIVVEELVLTHLGHGSISACIVISDHTFILTLRRAIRGKFKYTGHINKLTDKGLLICEVVNMVVLELIEVCTFSFLIDDDRQYLTTVELRWPIKVDLPEQG